MSSYENFPKKCVRCGATDVELHKFTYAKSKAKFMSNSFSTRHISFPVCTNCKQVFDKSLKIESRAASMKYVTICSSILAFSFGYTVFFNIFDLWLAFLFLVTLGLTITGIILLIRTKADPNRISNYISFQYGGRVEIKDETLKRDMVEQMTTKIIEQGVREATGVGMITCPKCGSQQLRETDYCKNCGKDLRYI